MVVAIGIRFAGNDRHTGSGAQAAQEILAIGPTAERVALAGWHVRGDHVQGYRRCQNPLDIEAFGVLRHVTIDGLAQAICRLLT